MVSIYDGLTSKPKCDALLDTISINFGNLLINKLFYNKNIFRKRMMKLKSWKKSVLVFSIATGLLITATAITAIKTTHAAPNTKKVTPMHKQNHQQTIKNIKKLAIQGKTVNSENFSLQSKTSHIVKKWGEPDEGSDASYLYYSKRG